MLTRMVCLGWKKYLEMQSLFWEKKLWILRSNRRKKVVGVRRGNTHKSKLFWTRNPWLNIKMGQMGVFDGVMKNNREGRWARILSHQKPQNVLTEGIESFFSNSVKNLTVAEYSIKFIWNCKLFQFVFYRILTLRF